MRRRPIREQARAKPLRMPMSWQSCCLIPPSQQQSMLSRHSMHTTLYDGPGLRKWSPPASKTVTYSAFAMKVSETTPRS